MAEKLVTTRLVVVRGGFAARAAVASGTSRPHFQCAVKTLPLTTEIPPGVASHDRIGVREGTAESLTYPMLILQLDEGDGSEAPDTDTRIIMQTLDHIANDIAAFGSRARFASIAAKPVQRLLSHLPVPIRETADQGLDSVRVEVMIQEATAVTSDPPVRVGQPITHDCESHRTGSC